MAKHFTPNDLAFFVSRELSRSRIKEKKPSEPILRELFNTLFYTSLQTEEGQFIKVTVTLLDHQSIDPLEEGMDRHDNWKFFPFEPAIEFSIKNLIKLSKAADPWSSSLSVYYDEHNKLFIYGMIDQTVHYQSFLNYEREEKPLHPGIIQTMINGIGILNVMLDYHPIATLNQHSLVKLYPNVFEHGPVSAFIQRKTAYSHQALEKKFNSSLSPNETEIFNDIIFEYVIQSICRILLKIKSYNHGGALLITGDFEADLSTKYKLQYDRVESAIMNILTAVTNKDLLADEVAKMSKKKGLMTTELYATCEDNKQAGIDSHNELIGAIRFVSSLSCVDGLVLLSPHLQIKGFGTVITEKKLPEHVWVSKSSRPSQKSSRIDAAHFGTRHQSMFAYCLKHPDSLGFVVSQDGEIRAIQSVNGKVMMWENIKVYQFLTSNKMPKFIFRKRF
ncbi:putative sensor domain DACNV-containing protein [Pedobacter nutrimenti]|uniref:Probable sensor domain-containing protein n=1 Tax=Pedobacter nutrimenti TaxID=1241337 RepID=A0A318UPK7_9SPHI|nr:hypothetical protein [Pedobacter nutrimenti]PYF77058.1 hypothetical protein B0O44_101536 [Pedobacter nutrimenti]